MAYTRTPLYAFIKRTPGGDLEICLDSIANTPHTCSRKIGPAFSEGFRRSGFKVEQIEISTVIRARRDKKPVQET